MALPAFFPCYFRKLQFPRIWNQLCKFFSTKKNKYWIFIVVWIGVLVVLLFQRRFGLVSWNNFLFPFLSEMLKNGTFKRLTFDWKNLKFLSEKKLAEILFEHLTTKIMFSCCFVKFFLTPVFRNFCLFDLLLIFYPQTGTKKMALKYLFNERNFNWNEKRKTVGSSLASKYLLFDSSDCFPEMPKK